MKSSEVECKTLDSVVEEYKIKHIDWPKINVEGNEIPVFEVGGKALRMTESLILKVPRGDEISCRRLTTAAGLAVVSREDSLDVSNWYLRWERAE